MSALHGDPTFNQFNNHYDVASYERICDEFELTHQAIFALHNEKTTALDMYTYMRKARQKQKMNIRSGINSVMRAAKRSKEI